MRNRFAALILVAALAGCQSMDADTAGRTLGGAGVGAAGGTVIGALAGNWGAGAGIGALVGGVGGVLYDQWSKRDAGAREDAAVPDDDDEVGAPIPLAKP